LFVKNNGIKKESWKNKNIFAEKLIGSMAKKRLENEISKFICCSTPYTGICENRSINFFTNLSSKNPTFFKCL
jgi:hypothetical protein